MLPDKCRLAIEKYGMLSEGDSVIVGLSGGADSCALLYYLCSLREELSLRIVAVHVNHMIRGGEAERDAAFAETFCEKLKVEFRLYRRDIPAMAAQKGIGLEQCGREVRYAIFEEESKQCGGKIATAHTLSDSVETVLFHIIRGCAVNGLKGIPAVRGNIIRPLIGCERSDIEAYCAAHRIEYVTDSTNLTTDYARNKIRLQILPLMKEMNPSVVEAIGRLSECAAADDGFLCEAADRAAEDFLKYGRADILFASEPPVASRALMKICAARLPVTPEQKHIAAMCDSLRRGTGSVNLPGDNVFSVRNHTVVLKKKSEITKDCQAANNWNVEFVPGEIITPSGHKIISRIIEKNKYNELLSQNRKNEKNVYKNSLDCDRITRATFRFRREGDTFSPVGRKCTKSLKKLFNEEKIPTAIRGQLPLLESDGNIAWISGIGVSEPFRVNESTQKVLYIEE